MDLLDLQEWIAPKAMHLKLLNGALNRLTVSGFWIYCFVCKMATEYEQHYNKIVFFLTTFSPRNKNWGSGLPCPTKDGNLVSTLAVHHVSISCYWIDILGTIFTAFLKISPRGVSKEIMSLFSYCFCFCSFTQEITGLYPGVSWWGTQSAKNGDLRCSSCC